MNWVSQVRKTLSFFFFWKTLSIQHNLKSFLRGGLGAGYHGDRKDKEGRACHLWMIVEVKGQSRNLCGPGLRMEWSLLPAEMVHEPAQGWMPIHVTGKERSRVQPKGHHWCGCQPFRNTGSRPSRPIWWGFQDGDACLPSSLLTRWHCPFYYQRKGKLWLVWWQKLWNLLFCSHADVSCSRCLRHERLKSTLQHPQDVFLPLLTLVNLLVD